MLDKEKLNIALDNIGSNYRKILLVNLTTDIYQPVTIADDEYILLNDDKSFKISKYWKWFCNSDFVHVDDREVCLNYDPVPHSHIVYRRKINNVYRWVLMELIPATDYTENNKSCVCYVRDINNIYEREYTALVDKLGTTDGLTGLMNLNAFERDKTKHINEKVGFVYADVNGLKFINDNQGHKAGDDLILKFASLILLNFNGCSCYHLHGDEFLIACYNASLREFISKAVSFHKSIWVGSDIPIASIGYSIGESGEFELALEEAEKEMYDDKRIFYSKFPKYKRK